MQRLPFQTQNRSLAIALHTAGAPIIEIRNVYTPEQLKQWGFETATEAVKAKRPGRIVFLIERTERLEQLIAAYDQQAAMPDDQTFEIEDDVEDDIRAVRLVCHSQRTRVAIQKCVDDPLYAWELHVRGDPGADAKRVEDAFKNGQEITVQMPGFVAVNAMASDKTRKRFRL